MGLESHIKDDGTLLELIEKTEVPQEILDILNLMARRLVNFQEGYNGRVDLCYWKKGDMYLVNGSYSEVIDGHRSEGSFVISLAAGKRS